MRQSFGIAVVVLFGLSGVTLPAQRGRGEAPAAGPEGGPDLAAAFFGPPEFTTDDHAGKVLAKSPLYAAGYAL